MSQMREEFEAWVVAQGSSIMRCGTIHDPSPVYMYVETQAMWLAWKASREALAVELPLAFRYCDSQDATDIREAIESAGLKVAP